jgi:hypothetical protein
MTKTQTPDENDSLLSVRCDDESRVRYRSERSAEPGTTPQPSLDSSRPQRLARALRFAELLLDMLPPGDSSRGLLELAIKRRDEALLEGVLRELYRQQKQTNSGKGGG